MYTIHFNQIRFNAFHGLFEEEKIAGEEFELDLAIQYKPQGTPVKHLEETLNYAALYETVKTILSQREDLLETIVYNIAKTILNEYPLTEEVEVYLKKLQPPIAHFTGSVGVKFRMTREKIKK